MNWNYRLMRYDTGALGIHEVYYDDDGDIISFTEEAVGVTGENTEEIGATLRQMAKDIDAYILNYDETCRMVEARTDQEAPDGS